MKMKKQLLTIATIACISIAGVSMAVANASHHDNPMRSFAKLKLSDEQKQEMRSIFKATRENNSVYAGEKKEVMAQMHTLMNMPAWDKATAETIIKTQLEQVEIIALNRAKARNQVYNLLTDEQKAKLAERKAKKAQRAEAKEQRKALHHDKAQEGKNAKGKHKGKSGKKHSARLAKALNLTEEQVEKFKVIDANAKQEMLALKEQSNGHRATMDLLVQSPNFDENLWLAAHQKGLDKKLAFKLIQTKALYDRTSLLNEEQKEKFAKIMKKMKGKRDRAGFSM